MSRAEKEMAAAAGGDGSMLSNGRNSNGSSRAALAAPPDVGECVDNLRAEVASARVLVQLIKQKPELLK